MCQTKERFPKARFRYEFSPFGHLNLFRVSGFELRICPHPVSFPHSPQLLLYSLPMGAVPEEFATSTTHEILVEPKIRPRRDTFVHAFLVHLLKLATAFHTPRLAHREMKFVQD